MQATREYIEGLTSFISGRDGIKFRDGQGFSADVKNKVVTLDMVKLTQMEFNKAKGLILHETGHIKHTEDAGKTELQEKYPHDMQEIYNMAEDLRIEQRLEEEYGSFAREPIKTLNNSALEEIASQPEKIKQMSPLDQAMLGIQARELTCRYSGNHRSYHKICENIRPEIQRIIPDGVGAIYHTSQARSLEELKRMVDREIYPLIKEYVTDRPDGNESGIMQRVKKGIGTTEQNPVMEDIPTDKELSGLLSPYIRTLTQRLGNILKEKAITRYTGNYKTGKLLSPNAYKAITGDTRIFSRKTNPNKPKYTVSLVLDESGSMAGPPHTQTYIASFLINETMKKLGFKVNLIQYGDEANIIKELKHYRNIRGGGNNDHDAIVKLWEIIDRSDDNIVFIMTDGGVCQDPRPILQKFYNAQIPVIGVGVNLDDQRLVTMFTKFYKNAVLVPDVTKLSQVLINTVQRLIHR